MNQYHDNTSMVKTRMITRLAVVLAIAISPFSGGVEASYMKSNTVTPQCGGQCSHQEFRLKTKASPVQELIKGLMNMQ